MISAYGGMCIGMQSLEIRAQKGKEIADVFGSINRLDETTYKVKSQSMNVYYEYFQLKEDGHASAPITDFEA